MLFSPIDLALYDRRGRLTAVAEVKRKLGTSAEWAAKTRRNMLAHGGLTHPEFFLLVTVDRLYVWKGAGTDPVPTPPTYEADPTAGFAPYFDRAGIDPQRISPYAFELLVGAWLGDVIRSEDTSEEIGSDQGWLVQSGFLKAVRDGRIEYQSAE